MEKNIKNLVAVMQFWEILYKKLLQPHWDSKLLPDSSVATEELTL